MKKYIGEKHISIGKKLLFLFAVILAIFGIINGVWYFGYKATYDKLSSKMEPIIDMIDETAVRYTTTVDNYSFVLKMPSYLGEGGFISVSDTEGVVTELDSNNNIVSSNGTIITLFIWPQQFGGYKLGVDFYDEAAELWEQVYINSDLTIALAENLDGQYIQYLEELLSDYATEIQDLIVAAETLWKIDL